MARPTIQTRSPGRPATSSVRRRARQLLIGAVKVTVGGGLLWLLVRNGKLDPAAVAAAVRYWPYLAATLGLFYLQQGMAAYRWNLLLGVQGVSLPFSKAFSLTMIGALFNIALPGAVGGDVIKAYYVSRYTETRKTQVVTSILIDRVVGLLGLLGLASVAGLMKWNLVWSQKALAAVFAFAVAGFVTGSAALILSIAASEKTAALVDRFAHRLPFSATITRMVGSLLEYRSRPVLVWKALGVSLACQVLGCIGFYFCALSLRYSQIPVGDFFLVVPLGLTTTALPVSPAGIGVGQAAFFALFQFLPGATAAMGATACTVFQFLVVVLDLTGFGFYLSYKREVAEVRLDAAGQAD